ncbi:MAG: UDP-N-acetylmuramoylalanyl-D-glutamyl-2, 6-diaminopimelate--D-alanyl-D-alanine ligase, partial [Alphaproteobacteria bacterium CG_4_10_14_0_8_um_filter_53_9]
MLWTLGEICGALGVAVPSESDAGLAVTGVSIDSRTVVAGDVFVALKGTPGGGFVSSFGSAGDGHDYVKMAIEKGTVAVIVDHEMAGVTVPQIVVPCTHMEGLWKLGEAARTRFEGLVIGLTGSAGKSGTKELLAALLDAPASVGSYNNFWGVPLTLARLDPLAKFAVLEMGMNQVGEMARLSALVRPHVAVVVNVLPVHLEHIGSLEGIRQEKLSIAAGLVEEGLLVLPEGLSAQES